MGLILRLVVEQVATKVFCVYTIFHDLESSLILRGQHISTVKLIFKKKKIPPTHEHNFMSTYSTTEPSEIGAALNQRTHIQMKVGF